MVIGSLWVRAESARVVLGYEVQSGDEACEPVRAFTSFTRTPGHFGGERHWFVCPKCA